MKKTAFRRRRDTEFDMRHLWIEYNKKASLLNKSLIDVMNDNLTKDNGQECYNILHNRYKILNESWKTVLNNININIDNYRNQYEC